MGQGFNMKESIKNLKSYRKFEEIKERIISNEIYSNGNKLNEISKKGQIQKQYAGFIKELTNISEKYGVVLKNKVEVTTEGVRRFYYSLDYPSNILDPFIFYTKDDNEPF